MTTGHGDHDAQSGGQQPGAPLPAPNTEAAIDWILDRCQTFAMVGASPKPSRPSNGVMRTLLAAGYDVVPVNPTCDQVHERRAYPDLLSVPSSVEIDVVDIFRRSDAAGIHVDEAIARGADAVWLQLRVIDEAAAARAHDAGLVVVMDRCPAIELRRREHR